MFPDQKRIKLEMSNRKITEILQNICKLNNTK